MELIYHIHILLNELVEDIEAYIHKAMDVIDPSQEKTYHIRADRSPLDRGIIKRMLDSRDSAVRFILQRYLRERQGDYGSKDFPAVDVLSMTQGVYLYHLAMPQNWNKNLLAPLTQNIHDYLVNGVLYDYYRKNMPEMAKTIDFEQYAENIKSVICQRVGLSKRPLRPF